VAGCCECGDEPSGSCATELVSYSCTDSVKAEFIVCNHNTECDCTIIRSRIFIKTWKFRVKLYPDGIQSDCICNYLFMCCRDDVSGKVKYADMVKPKQTRRICSRHICTECCDKVVSGSLDVAFATNAALGHFVIIIIKISIHYRWNTYHTVGSHVY
jgi:hypothetical protein